MGILVNLLNRIRPKSSPTPPPVNLGSLPPQKSDPKSQLIQLETQLKQEALLVQKQSQLKSNQPKLKPKWMGKLISLSLLVGIPSAILYIINLPYPAIRQPVSRTVPFLLLPSQINIENNFKRSLELIEQAEQLIERPTSASDIEQGAQRLKEGKDSLDAIPLNSVDEWIDYGGYGWRFSRYRFQQIREQVGRLEAKVFQEKNAQSLLVMGEQELITVKTAYQQAASPTDKQAAARLWRSTLDKMEEIPDRTWAGKSAQQKLNSYEREFNEVVGLAANTEKVNTLISSAQQFSRQATLIGQNPPHTVDKWQEIEKLWQIAIDDLNQISPQDLNGYAEARKLIAEYTAIKGQIRVQRKAEQNAAVALESAQNRIETLLASTPNDIKSFDRNRTISQLQAIINDLDKVEKETTSYPKAQKLRLFAKNKFDQLEANSQ